MSAAAGGRQPMPTIGTPKRFTDDDGIEWTISERDARMVPGARGPRCLIFQSDEAVRRIWEYPAGWRDLLNPSLIALSWGC